MDKSWIHEKNTFSESYEKGVKAFLEFSKANNGLGKDQKLFCPCRICINNNRKTLDDVKRDLHINGFSRCYTNWVFHGEIIQPSTESANRYETGSNDVHTEYDDNSPIDELPELLEEVQEARNSRSSIDYDSEDFERLMNDAKKEAYPGCQKYSVLLYVVTLLHIKVMCHWSNKSFNMLLEFLKDLLPEGNNVPSTLYGAMSMLSGIGMKYEKIDACKHDCALFWKENQDKDKCPVCGESRWKSVDKKGKKVPQKVLWYFPLQPRLQRLFMSSKSASNMRWHAEKRINEDGVMRHPADSPAWKDFDSRYPNFAQDSRNVRLGLATDGFSPFGDMSNPYSIWPVILVPYNMSAFEFMKQEYFMLTLLISGPNSPGQDIDVYLRPMVDELKELWDNGISTYDASSGEVFQMHAALLWTIHDFPAYGNISGWSTSGYKACPRCFDETSAVRLRDKIGYIGHRRSLRINHPWRKNKRAFDGKVEKRGKPKEWTGSEILHRLKSHKHLFKKPGKHPNNKKRKYDPILGNWRKISILNELPYWPYNKLPHNIDVMHMAPIGTRLTRGEFQRTNAQIKPSFSTSTSDSTGNVVVGDKDNANPEAVCSNALRKVRGKSRGVTIERAIAKNGGRKLRIFIPKHLARPVENASMLATGIGIIMRNHAPLINVKVYDDIHLEDKLNLYGGLEAWFEFVDIETDPLIKEKLDAMLRNAFTHWKNRMHTAYSESKNAGLNPLEHCPFDWFDEGVWEAMCGTFEEPKFQRRSDINKRNRSKVQYPHASGSQPFHVRYYNMPEAERSHIKNWRDCHTRRNGCMVNDKAKSLAEEMDTKKRLLDEAGQEVVEEDILADTLGTKSGYRKGMGYGFVCSQPAKRICNSEALKNAQTTIEQQKLMIDDLRSELGTMKESQIKLQANMDKLLAIFGNF